MLKCDRNIVWLLQNTSTSQPSSDHLNENSNDLEKLKAIAKPVREKKKVPPDIMREVILNVSKDNFLTLQQLETILDRTNSTLRT